MAETMDEVAANIVAGENLQTFLAYRSGVIDQCAQAIRELMNEPHLDEAEHRGAAWALAVVLGLRS